MENAARSLPPMPEKVLRATRSVKKGPDYAKTPPTDEAGPLRGNSGVVRIGEVDEAREPEKGKDELDFDFSDFEDKPPAPAQPETPKTNAEPAAALDDKEKTAEYDFGVLNEQVRKMRDLEREEREKTGVYDMKALVDKMNEPEPSADPVEAFDRDQVLAAAGMQVTTPKDERVEMFDRADIPPKKPRLILMPEKEEYEDEVEELDDEYLEKNMVEVKIPQLNLKERGVTNMSLYNPDGTKKSQTLSREEADEALGDLDAIRNKIQNSGK